MVTKRQGHCRDSSALFEKLVGGFFCFSRCFFVENISAPEPRNDNLSQNDSNAVKLPSDNSARALDTESGSLSKKEE